MLDGGPPASIGITNSGTQERTACNRARQVRMSSLGNLREKNLSGPSMTYRFQDENKYKRTHMYNCITCI